MNPTPADAEKELDTDELFEAEYKLQNCIRVTLNVEHYTTEVNTGKRWVPVTRYIEALIDATRADILRTAIDNIHDEIDAGVPEDLASRTVLLQMEYDAAHPAPATKSDKE